MVGMLLFGFMSMNFILGYSSGFNETSLSLKNLRALQASAGEVYCDQSDETTCTIEVEDENGTIYTGISKGKVVGSGNPF